MTEDARTVVTRILSQLCAEGATPDAAPEQLLPVVYAELRRLAGGYLRNERPDHTLQATELVHDAYMKLVDQSRVEWNGRTHFFAVAAQAMRRLLIDHARRRKREKHGGEHQRVTLNDALDASPSADCDLEDLLALDDALERLALQDARQAQIVEMRCFTGMKIDEIAQALGVSKRTVEGDWTHARAWLRRQLSDGGAS